MLQAGAGTVGQGVGGLQQAQQAMMQGYAPLDAATQMTGNAVMGAQPYQQVAYDAMAKQSQQLWRLHKRAKKWRLLVVRI
jgi:hypothetical protein